MDPKGTGQGRWAMRRKPALNAFHVTFADRMPAAETSNTNERQKHRSSDGPDRYHWEAADSFTSAEGLVG